MYFQTTISGQGQKLGHIFRENKLRCNIFEGFFFERIGQNLVVARLVLFKYCCDNCSWHFTTFTFRSLNPHPIPDQITLRLRQPG